MKLIDNILVIMDASTEYQASLVQAIKIAKQTSATIDLFLVAYNTDFISHFGLNQTQLDSAKKEYLATKTRWIKTYATEVKALDINVNIDVVWHSDVSNAILAKVGGKDYSIVIKSTKQDSLIDKIFFTPSDWHLLEHCSAPVLLTKKAENSSYQQIMSAINPYIDQYDDAKLDNEILKANLAMANLFGGKSHVCHCYDPKNAELWQNMSKIGLCDSLDHSDFNNGKNEIEKKTKTIFEKLLIDFTFDESLIHIVEGCPVDEIPELVKSEKVDLLVMGMCNNGKYIGNTIEKVLDNVECDLLSIKFPG